MKANRRFPLTEILIVLLAVGALVAAAYVTARRSENASAAYDTMSTYDAASGGYRAWYELLANEGVRVQRFERRPAFLDPSVDIYVMAANYYGGIARAQSGKPYEQITTGDWDAVAKWIRAGGRLIWLADGKTSPEEVNAPLLELSGPSEDAAVTVAPSAITAGVAAVSGTAKLRVEFGQPGEAPLVADDTGGVVVAYPLGKGRMVIVTDESLFENARLDKAGNARLAFNLATAGLGPHGSVAFDEWSHGYIAGDTWWKILPAPFQAALVAIAVALLALVVGTALRFGPVATLPENLERTSAEYLSSMALLFERGRAYRAAIGDLVHDCLSDVCAAVGLPEAAPARAICARLEGAAGRANFAEAVMNLDRLRSYESPTPADLIRAASLCAALRKEFTRHGRIGIGRRAPAARRAA